MQLNLINESQSLLKAAVKMRQKFEKGHLSPVEAKMGIGVLNVNRGAINTNIQAEKWYKYKNKKKPEAKKK